VRGRATRTEAIVNAALELAERHGVAGVTTAALAEQLDFTEAALYRYFPAKGAIIAAALHHAGERLFATMMLELLPEATQHGQKCEEQLARHAKRFSLRGGLLLELVIWAAATCDSVLQAAGSEFLHAYDQRLTRYFGDLCERGLTVSTLSPEDVARLWICQLLGGFVRCRLGRERWDPVANPGFRAFIAQLQPASNAPAS
jgi:AcrR family transcriptional regulator